MATDNFRTRQNTKDQAMSDKIFQKFYDKILNPNRVCDVPLIPESLLYCQLEFIEREKD